MQNQNPQSNCLLMLSFILEISPALNNLQQTLESMTVQKEVMDTNITAIRDDLRGIERGQHLLNPPPYLAYFVQHFRYLHLPICMCIR